MKTLTAEFKLELTEALLLKCPEDYEPTFSVSIDGFHVELSVHTDRTAAVKMKKERYFTFPYDRLTLCVTRTETELPTVTSPTHSGGRDYASQSDYFEKRKKDYLPVAKKALRRFLTFFRYRMRQPISLKIILANPTWKGEAGNVPGRVHIELFLCRPPGMEGEFGVTPFRKEHESHLLKALQSDRKYSLSDEFLADAQSAAFDCKYPRAVIELAIACEVAAKQKLYGTASTASRTLAYFEDKGRMATKTLDLIDVVAQQVLGQSFKVQYPNDFRNIDYLFRCRNKVAHRGTATYKDEHGIVHRLDRAALESWWQSAVRLLMWLRRA